MSDARPSGAPDAPDGPRITAAPGAGRDPRLELGAALFFALWPLAGWWAVSGDAYLWSDFGADPGPSLMPAIVLTLLSAGSLAMVLRALVLLRAGRATLPPGPLVSRLLTPLLFVVTLLALVPLMQAVGFVAAGALFAAGWMLALRDRARTHGPVRHLLEVVLATAIGIGLIYYVFARVIDVPLP